MFKMQYVRSNVQGALCKMECVRCNVKMGLLVRPAGHISWTDQLDGPADRPAGQTSSFYLKPWPVRIFEDFPFSLYIGAASESDKSLVVNSFKNWLSFCHF